MSRAEAASRAMTDGHDAGTHEIAELSAADRLRAQHVLVILGRLGETVHSALVALTDTRFVGNVEVLTLTSLDLQGPLRPTDVMALTGMSSGGVTKLLDRLEQEGLVRRQYGAIPDDRRGTLVALTPEGKRVATRFATALASEMTSVREAIEHLREAAGD